MDFTGVVRYMRHASTLYPFGMPVSEITSRAQIAAALCNNPVANAYPLGYLDESYADYCRWFGFRREGELISVILHYKGLSRPGLFSCGEREGIRPILRELRDEMPARATAHLRKEHRDAFGAIFDGLDELPLVSRMGLSRDEFRDIGDPGPVVERLTHRDTARIMELYRLWPDNFFEPYQLETGLYFGVKLDDGSVAAIAGVHNLSLTYDVAAIGNLVTHPDHRGHGYAKACTARLLRDAFDRVGYVTLDVRQENEPAVRTYRRFGFREFAEFYEGEITRR